MMCLRKRTSFDSRSFHIPRLGHFMRSWNWLEKANLKDEPGMGFEQGAGDDRLEALARGLDFCRQLGVGIFFGFGQRQSHPLGMVPLNFVLLLQGLQSYRGTSSVGGERQLSRVACNRTLDRDFNAEELVGSVGGVRELFGPQFDIW